MESKPNSKILLVLDGNSMHNWAELFLARTLANGDAIRVIQASWNEVTVVAYPEIPPLHDSEGSIRRPATTTFRPDFVLARNQPRGPTPATDRRNVLYGLMMGNVPSINSMQSLYLDLERASMVGELRAVQARLGAANFPLVPITYYAYPDNMVIFDKFPSVAKVSHAHAGMGKQKLENSTAFRDLSTVLALHNDYCTVEPFIECDYGIRIQKIGNHYRVYKKVFTGSGWKSQFGGADLQFMELNDKFKLWADECAKCYGGMDLLAIDVLVDKEGNYWILELNGTAIGIQAQYWAEDSACLVDLVVDRMSSHFTKATTAAIDTSIAPSESTAEWQRHNSEREKHIAQLQKLKVEIKREREEMEKEREEGASEELATKTLVAGAVSLVVGLVLGGVVSRYALNS